MTQEQWKIERHSNPRIKGLFYFRNMAVKYFNLQKGEVIHHLRDTEEQRQFNDQYYERWGFDFNNEMKFCIKMTVEEHRKYHQMSYETKQKISKNTKIGMKKVWDKFLINNRKASKAKVGIPFSEEHRKHMSEAQKGKHLSEEHKKHLSEINLGKHHSEETKQKLRNIQLGKHLSEETKQKMSKSKKGKPAISNPPHKYECIETGEILFRKEWIKKGYYPYYGISKNLTFRKI